MYSLHCLLHIKKCLEVRLSPHYPNPCPRGSILIPRPEISRDFLMAAPKSSEGILAPHELLTDGPRQLIRSDRKVKMSRETLNSLFHRYCVHHIPDYINAVQGMEDVLGAVSRGLPRGSRRFQISEISGRSRSFPGFEETRVTTCEMFAKQRLPVRKAACRTITKQVPAATSPSYHAREKSYLRPLGFKTVLDLLKRQVAGQVSARLVLASIPFVNGRNQLKSIDASFHQINTKSKDHFILQWSDKILLQRLYRNVDPHSWVVCFSCGLGG